MKQLYSYFYKHDNLAYFINDLGGIGWLHILPYSGSEVVPKIAALIVYNMFTFCEICERAKKSVIMNIAFRGIMSCNQRKQYLIMIR